MVRAPRPAVRCLAAATVGLAVLATSWSGSGPARADEVAGECWLSSPTDVDGDGPDIVIGLPSYDLPGKADAGAIVVYSNVGAEGVDRPSTPAAATLVTAVDVGLTAQAGARFGASLAVADVGPLDPDHCADVVVGAPGQTVGGKTGAGAVYLLTGSPDGLGLVSGSVDEASLDSTGGAQAGSGFGSEISLMPELDDGFVLAVGAPWRDVGGKVDAGRVVRIDDWGSGSTGSATVIEQGSGAPGAAETGDHFGAVIRAKQSLLGVSLVVGVPDEDLGTDADAGTVVLLPPSGTPSAVNQDSANAAGTAEAGDRFGAALSMDDFDSSPGHVVTRVVIGAPGEDAGTISNSGVVGAATFTGAGPLIGQPQSWSQGKGGAPGSAEAGDRFGSAVVVGTFADQQQAMVVSAPLENLGSSVDAGTMVQSWLPASGIPGSSAWQPGSWNQDTKGVSTAVETGDQLGAALGWVQLTRANDEADYRLVVVTVPGEDLSGITDAGLAYVGTTPGSGTVALQPPVLQTGAGLGMVPMRMLG